MSRLAARLCLTLVFVTGCRGAPPAELVEPGLGIDPKPERAAVEPERSAAVEPACSVTLGSEGKLIVDGQPIALELPTEAKARVRSFPHDDHSILFAVGSETPWWPFFGKYPSDTLWKLSCDHPSELEVFGQIEGADFSWAELDPAGTGLYFSLGAVHRYDFSLRDHGPVTTPPRLDPCWMNEPVVATEFVAGWVGDDRLLIYWGGPCGFEAEWMGGTAVIEDPGGVAKRRPSAFVGSIAADPSGHVWVGDGGLCVEPQWVLDLGSPGVWRSDDVGRSWTFMPIPQLAHGIDAIWFDTETPGRVSVHAECCYPGPADGCKGGERLHSDDGGRTWQLDDPGGQVQPTPPAPRSVTLDGWVLEATLDGVNKRRADEPGGAGTIVLFPGVD